MKKITKHCFAALLPLLISSNFATAATYKATEQDTSKQVTKQTQQDTSKQVTKQTQQGKLIWADLYSGDVQSSVNFYTNTFDWTVKKFDKKQSSYHLFYDGEQPIAGVLARSAQRNKTDKALWIGSIASNEVQAQVTSAANNQATIILEPHDFALYGERAVLADPQGGVIALLDLDENNKEHQNISTKWDWAQLFSVDTNKAASFYHNSFDYSIDKIANTKNGYFLSQQDEISASIVKLPASFEQRDRWVNFVEVVNLATTLAKATKNGGQIIYQPAGNQLAIIADPSGALLGLTEQESE